MNRVPCRFIRQGIGCLLVATSAGAQQRDASRVPADTTRPTMLQASVVTATRSAQTVQSVPVSVAVFDLQAIEASAAKSVADFLRVVPGFSLRDHQSALISHPSRHSPAMRGLGGGSSSSKILVLLDGVPLNDPFAGWVHWSRVPMALLGRAEVVRGGGSGVWGDRALGGVINLMTVDPNRNDVQLSVSGGTHGTARTGGSVTRRQDKLSLQVAGDYTTTDGYIVVPQDLRGPIDTPSGARDLVGYARARYDFTPLASAFFSGNFLDEQRDNATPLRENDTDALEMRGGMQWITSGGSRLAAHVFANKLTHQHFFTTESLDRQTETPSLNQHTPATSAGAQASWSREVMRHQLSGGVDLSLIEGTVNEDQAYSNGRFTRHRRVEGKQSLWGAYVQDAYDITNRARLLASLRFDTRRTHDARRQESDVINNVVLIDTLYNDIRESRVSHNLGLRMQATDAIAFRLSNYSAFRSPTLNEFFKPFREAGNTIVEANPSLDTERLTGYEAGIDITAGRAVARLTAFHTRIHDPIFELTVEAAGSTGRVIAPCGFVPAGGTCRQRRNVDLVESRGLEAELDLHVARDVTLRGSYGFNPTEVLRASAQPELVGKEARSSARHSYTLIAAYDRPSLANVAVTVRSASRRFEDDLNRLDLGSFVVADIRASKAVTRQAQIFVGVENMFDAEYPISRANSGLVRTGGPRMFEGGIRYRW
jgi:outer membrane cobalamin receptor